MQSSPSRPLLSALLALAAVILPNTVRAHAIAVEATPAVDAIVHGSTLPVSIRFNSRIDRDRSRLSLIKPDRSAETLSLAANGGPDTLAATVKDLVPGHYRLRWQVLGIDGHITRGDIPFEIVP